VHEDVPGLAIVEGAHDIELTASGSRTVTLAPVAITGIMSPAPELALAPATPMAVEPVENGRVTVTTATGPSGMGVLFMPTARQMIEPVRWLHDSVLLPAVAAGPALTLIEAIAAGAYVSVH
jgi:hypothetical protein